MLDPARMEDVLSSLVVNALEARGNGARVRLTARRQDSEVIELLVEDDGPGIDPSLRERLFRPFTSTKRSGTGLGLVICRKIVEQQGGTIEIVPSELGGAGFSKRCAAAANAT